MRWLVDAMNVIGSRPDGWWRDRPAAMAQLAEALAAFARRTGDDVGVVFDGHARAIGEHPPLDVAWAPGGRDAADAVIAARAGDDADPSTLTVVTSDAALAAAVRASGASVEGAGTFRRRLERGQPEGRE